MQDLLEYAEEPMDLCLDSAGDKAPEHRHNPLCHPLI